MNNSDDQNTEHNDKCECEKRDQSQHKANSFIRRKKRRDQDESVNKTKKELTIIKKKKGKFNPTYVVPPKNKFKSSSLLVNLIDRIIAKHDPLALLRAHRKYIINLTGANEPALLRQLTLKSSNVYYSNYCPMKLISVTQSKTNTHHHNSHHNHNHQHKANHFNVSDELTHLTKKQAKECEKEIIKEFNNRFVSSDEVTNIDILRYKCENNYYPSKEVILEDIVSLFDNIRRSLESLILSKYIDDNTIYESYLKYLSDIFELFIKNVNKLNIEELYNEDINQMIELNKLPRSSLQISSLPVKKDYEMIETYYHVKPEVTEPKTKTSIVSKCNGTCCDSFAKLGPLNLETSRWESHCIDRENNIECDSSLCGCNSETCKNQSLLTGNYKQLNKEVEERYSWGIDLFTYRNLLYLFPENYDTDNYFKHFIEKKLIVAFSKLGINGDKISNGCEYIVANSSLYSETEIHFAKHLLSIYKISLLSRNSINTAYSKGIGIFCINEVGIKQNELIAPYLGEIYPPWLWFEKQDIIKRKKLDMSLPDFYNILLERMKHDEDGYDILMIDPNSKGNFASRMSHSCDPNCNTVLMVSDHKYTIGMFAMKNIDKDEELTFDYNSVTEKEKEFQNAICLCSSFNCRGHYLILSYSMVFTEIMTKFHSFLHRNAILVKACALANKPLNDNEIDMLNQFSIKKSVLSGAPIWLQRWAALILDYVYVEKHLLPIILYKAEKQEKDDIELKRKREKEKDQLMKVIKEKEREKEKENSRSKRHKNTQNKQSTNYNFIDDYLWDKKKYVSSSRSTKIDIDASLLFYKDTKFNGNRSIFQLDKQSEIKDKEDSKSNDKNDINNIEYDKPESDQQIMEIDDESNKESFKKEEDSNTNNSPIEMNNNTNLIEEEGRVIEAAIDKDQNVQIPINIESILGIETTPTPIIIPVANNPLDNLHHQELKIDLNQFALDNDINANLDNDYDINTNILSFESNDFSFLSELNLQMEPGYNKTLFEAIQYQVSSITEQRIQNLVITIDKVKHVLSRLKSMECPLKVLTDEEVFNYYWKNNNSSIRGILIKKFLSMQKEKTDSTNQELKEKIDLIIQKLSYNPMPFISQSISYAKLNVKIRKVLIEISIIIRSLKDIDKESKDIYYEGLSDMLFLYSYTQIHFTPNPSLDRAQLLSESIQIRKRDVDPSCLPEKFKDGELDAIIEESHKEYENHYIWGQLAGWFKQTVDKPNASLSAERRGTLSYPELDSFFLKRNNEKAMSYPCGGRQLFFDKIEENVSRMWPVGNDWSYKNKQKIYGTVQFDAVYTHKFYLDKIKEYMKKVVNYITNQ